MDTTKRSPLDRLLFATFLKGRTSSRDIWEEKGDMTITQALFFGEWAKADEDEAELAEHLKLLQCDNWEEQFST